MYVLQNTWYFEVYVYAVYNEKKKKDSERGLLQIWQIAGIYLQPMRPLLDGHESKYSAIRRACRAFGNLMAQRKLTSKDNVHTYKSIV